MLSVEQEIAVTIIENTLKLYNDKTILADFSDFHDQLVHIMELCKTSPQFCANYLLQETEMVHAPVSLIKSVGLIIEQRKVEALLSPVDWIRSWASNIGDISHTVE